MWKYTIKRDSDSKKIFILILGKYCIKKTVHLGWDKEYKQWSVSSLDSIENDLKERRVVLRDTTPEENEKLNREILVFILHGKKMINIYKLNEL